MQCVRLHCDKWLVFIVPQPKHRLFLIHTTHQMSNRFIYIQNCLQQDFWINNDPRGVIDVQVHNTICTKVSSQQKKEKKETL